MDKILVWNIWQKSGILNPKWIGILNHMMGVAHVATYLASLINEAKPKTVDIEILEMSAMIHDCGKSIKDSPTAHTTHGVRLLRRLGIDERIVQAVLKHQWWSFKRRQPPTTWEGKLLFIADFIFGGNIQSLTERREDIFSHYLPGANDEPRRMAVTNELDKIKREVEKIIDRPFPFD